MIMTVTQVLNHVYSIACLIVAIGAELLGDPLVSGLLPHQVAHVLAVASVLALAVKNHKNLFINPDGTDAAKPYVRSDQEKPKS